MIHGGGDRPPVTENWLDACQSKDNAKSWTFLSKTAETDRGKRNGNQPALVHWAKLDPVADHPDRGSARHRPWIPAELLPADRLLGRWLAQVVNRPARVASKVVLNLYRLAVRASRH